MSPPNTFTVRAAGEAFARRYCDWALEECRHEVHNQFARVRRVGSMGVASRLEEMGKWSQREQLSFMNAVIRSLVLREPFGEDELALHERTQHALIWGEAVREFYKRGITEQKTKPFNRRAFRSLLERELAGILGAHRRDASISRFRTYVGNCTLCTDIDFGGRGRQVAYWHIVYAGRHEGYWPSDPDMWQLMLPRVSLAEWLGCGKSRWQFMTDENSESVAGLIRDWCGYFLAAAPALVDGLVV